jgi:predicted nucleotidyltransferase
VQTVVFGLVTDTYLNSLPMQGAVLYTPNGVLEMKAPESGLRLGGLMINSDPLVNTITAEIIAIAKPIEVILFGSRARNDAKADSDYDFCIIVDDHVRPLDVKLRLYAHIAKQYACDLLVFRKSDFEEGSKFSGLVQYSIAREGLKTYVQSAA